MESDLRDYAIRVLELAKENLRRDGVLVPLAFIITANEINLVEMDFQDHAEKERAYARLVETARAMNALALLTLNDAYHTRREADLDDYAEGYYPGRLAAEGAPECILMVLAGPAIATWELMQPYERTPQGIVFGAPRESSGGEVPFLEGWASPGLKPS